MEDLLKVLTKLLKLFGYGCFGYIAVCFIAAIITATIFTCSN